MAVGPLHVMVFAFDEPNFTGRALAELQKLEDHDVVRLVDLLFVQKDADGNIEALEVEDLDTEAAAVFGDLAGAFIDLDGDGQPDDGAIDDELWDIAAEIEPGTAAAIVLLEHRWAIGLRDALHDAGGRLVGDAIVPPEELTELSEEFAAGVSQRAGS